MYPPTIVPFEEIALLGVIFSPIFWTSCSREDSIPESSTSAILVASLLCAFRKTSNENSRKDESLAAKSVSVFTSTSVPRPSEIFIKIMPSAAVREAFFAAFIPLDFLNSSIATSMSPLAAIRAFLHSIMPRPVLSLKSLTSAAVTLLIYYLQSFKVKGVYTPLFLKIIYLFFTHKNLLTCLFRRIIAFFVICFWLA